MKSCFRILVCVLLALSLTVGALAAPRFPERMDDVTDAAAVLTQSVVTDLENYNKLISKADGLTLVVVTVDFLDGESIDDYAAQLRQHWRLKDDDLLLLMAVGEDRCAFSAGKDVRLSASVLGKLLSAYFEEPFLRQDYGEAVSLLIPPLTEEINKAYRTTLTSAGLFGAAAEPTADPISRLTGWTNIYRANPEATEKPVEDSRRVTDEDDDTGFSLWKILLTLFLLSVIFGKKKRRRMGCGCAPFSSILAVLGLWKLWDRK